MGTREQQKQKRQEDWQRLVSACKNIPIEEVYLDILGINTARGVSKSNSIFYPNPWKPDEGDPSLEVNRDLNICTLQSPDYPSFIIPNKSLPSFNPINLVIAYRFRVNPFGSVDKDIFNDALKLMQPYSGIQYDFPEVIKYVAKSNSERTYLTNELIRKPSISDGDNIKYFTRERFIPLSILQANCVEYEKRNIFDDGTFNARNYVCMLNMKGGMAMRSNPARHRDFNKISTQPGSITLIDSYGNNRSWEDYKTENRTLRVFEGFTDYLSWLTIRAAAVLKRNPSIPSVDDLIRREPSLATPRDCDAVILNSSSNVNQFEPLVGEYDQIICYGDNDVAGRKAVVIIAEQRREFLGLDLNFTPDEVQEVRELALAKIQEAVNKAEAKIREGKDEDYVLSPEDKAELERVRNINCQSFNIGPRKKGETTPDDVKAFLDSLTPQDIWSKSTYHNLRPLVNEVLFKRLTAVRGKESYVISNYAASLGVSSRSVCLYGKYNDFNEFLQNRCRTRSVSLFQKPITQTPKGNTEASVQNIQETRNNNDMNENIKKSEQPANQNKYFELDQNGKIQKQEGDNVVMINYPEPRKITPAEKSVLDILQDEIKSVMQEIGLFTEFKGGHGKFDLDEFYRLDENRGCVVVDAIVNNSITSVPVGAFTVMGKKVSIPGIQNIKFLHNIRRNAEGFALKAPQQPSLVYQVFPLIGSWQRNDENGIIIPLSYVQIGQKLNESSKRSYNGKYLSADMMKELAKTGRLSRPINPFSKKPECEYWEPGCNCDINDARVLQIEPASQQIFGMRVGVIKTRTERACYVDAKTNQKFIFNPSQIADGATGCDVFLTEINSYVHYDISKGQYVKGNSYEQMKREELSEAEDRRRAESPDIKNIEAVSEKKGMGING